MTTGIKAPDPAKGGLRLTMPPAKGGLRLSMAWLHNWAGLLCGWLVFVVFLFGTAAFFNQEISAWMRPELDGGALSPAAIGKLETHLSRTAPAATAWMISLPGNRGGEPVGVRWQGPQGRGEADFDPADGDPVAVRDTRGGAFLFSFHYNLHYLPWWLARYLVGAASLAMLLVLVSGIIIHKRIFADFFLLRFHKGQRSWLDVHNLSAVLALPFHLMITYTGLVTLFFMLMPWPISANFPDRAQFSQSIRPGMPIADASGVPAAMLPLAQLLHRVEMVSGGLQAGHITIHHPCDRAAIAEIQLQTDRLGAPYRPLYLDAVSGNVLQAPLPPGPALASHGVMTDLHAGRFADPVLRWLYFLSGLAGTGMVATGLVLWTVKRRARLAGPGGASAGFRLVEGLNIGVIAGGPAGIAGYFLANRLLPAGMAQRAEWEIHCLFIVWGAFLVWAFARPAGRAWMEALSACAALYALIPLVNALTTPRGLPASLLRPDRLFAAFDLTMLALAALCLFAARLVAGKVADRGRPA